MPKPQTQRLTASSSLGDLIAWPLFEAVSKHELAVYLKLLALAAERKTRSLVDVKNRDLRVDIRTAVASLRGLEVHGLIRVVYNPRDRKERTIEVV